MDFTSYLFNTLLEENDTKFTEAIFRCIIIISQQENIANSIPANVIEKLNEYKNDEKLAKLSQQIINIQNPNSDFRSSLTKKWPIINAETLDPLLERTITNRFFSNVYTPISSSRSKSNDTRIVHSVLKQSKGEDISRSSHTSKVSSVDRSLADNSFQPNVLESHPRELIRRGLRSAMKRPDISLTMNNIAISFNPYKTGKMGSISPIKKPQFMTNYSPHKIRRTSKPSNELHIINTGEYKEAKEQLYESFMNTNLLDKSSIESKMARNLLDLREIEAEGLRKGTGCTTIKGLANWYGSSKDYAKSYSSILYGVVSIQKTDKIIGLLHLIATENLGLIVNNPNIIN